MGIKERIMLQIFYKQILQYNGFWKGDIYLTKGNLCMGFI